MGRKTAHVRVQLIVDILVPGTWGNDCTVEQVYHQAVESAKGCLMGGLVIDGLTRNYGRKTGAIIVGEPKTNTVIIEE